MQPITGICHSYTSSVSTISSINNCGLESYWDYTSVGAGSAGTGYISQYTGNFVWVTDGLGFSGTRMPAAIKHVYNANDGALAIRTITCSAA